MRQHDSLLLPDYIEYPESEMLERSEKFYLDLRRRHTVRDFSDRPVPREIIDHCLRAAGTAPSGANHQPWHFTVIGSSEVKAKIRLQAEIEERRFYEDRRGGEEWLAALSPLGTDSSKPYLEAAPWLIAIFAERRGGVEVGMDHKNYYVPESVGIATGFLISALHNAGLVALTHTPKPMNFLNEICNRPTSNKAYILMVVGYPAQGATIPQHATLKKPLKDIVTYM
ncbi:MAG: nitroreductase family protein [Pseudomonadales bacterium]|nr:nitroreductase family protein [Pseudomonadales bacterium]NRA18500.1 nitroreductase family protein [Oceanospirillaceae bacterium]